MMLWVKEFGGGDEIEEKHFLDLFLGVKSIKDVHSTKNNKQSKEMNIKIAISISPIFSHLICFLLCNLACCCIKGNCNNIIV